MADHTMMKCIHRRLFLIASLLLTISMISLSVNTLWAADLEAANSDAKAKKPIRVGMIGLDTSHVLKFSSVFGDPKGDIVMVAAFPGGSPDIKSSWSRVEGYTKQMKERGIEICDSVESLLEKVDVVMIESVDGRPHIEYARKVLPTGKPTFIDKPVAGSLVDACEIYALAEKYNTPCFCSSALRYDKKADIKAGKVVGEVIGCETYSPASFEEHHPDFYWYGIHGVEPLFAVMGTGIDTVTRTHTKDADVVVGVWKDGRIGTFRGTRKGPHSYGGTVFGTKGQASIGGYDGAKELCKVITKFFKTKQNPFPSEETLEIYAFMTAADVSKEKGGCPVSVQKILEKAKAEAAKRIK